MLGSSRYSFQVFQTSKYSEYLYTVMAEKQKHMDLSHFVFPHSFLFYLKNFVVVASVSLSFIWGRFLGW